MNPFDYGASDSRQAPASDARYVAAVRPFDAVSPSDHQPLARVRYSNGKTFLARAHVRHIDLQRETGRPLEYWVDIDRLAHEVVQAIGSLTAQGVIRPVACFSELHYQMDPSKGWSPELDALTETDWAAVQWRVTDILRTG